VNVHIIYDGQTTNYIGFEKVELFARTLGLVIFGEAKAL